MQQLKASVQLSSFGPLKFINCFHPLSIYEENEKLNGRKLNLSQRMELKLQTKSASSNVREWIQTTNAGAQQQKLLLLQCVWLSQVLKRSLDIQSQSPHCIRRWKWWGWSEWRWALWEQLQTLLTYHSNNTWGKEHPIKVPNQLVINGSSKGSFTMLG